MGEVDSDKFEDRAEFYRFCLRGEGFAGVRNWPFRQRASEGVGNLCWLPQVGYGGYGSWHFDWVTWDGEDHEAFGTWHLDASVVDRLTRMMNKALEWAVLRLGALQPTVHVSAAVWSKAPTQDD